MQYNQPYFCAGPPTSLQFYPCFIPPPQPPPQTFPRPEAPLDVTSVVLPDGTVQMFFIPATKCGQCMQKSNYSTNLNSQTANGPWFIRSVNAQSTSLPPPAPQSQCPFCPPRNDHMALPPPRSEYQTNQGLKFHIDQSTSSEDLRYFCPASQQRCEEQRPQKPCCAGAVCLAPCKCSPDCVGIRTPERCHSREGNLSQCYSDMSIDECRRGKKRKKNVDCKCSSSSSIQNRKRHKRVKYLNSSTSVSSSGKEWIKQERARKKQNKKLIKEKKKREKEREKLKRQENRRRQKNKKEQNNARFNTSDQEQQKCDRVQCSQPLYEPKERTKQTCPQTGISLMSKLSSVISYLTKPSCNSSSACSTCSTTSTSKSCSSELNDESDERRRKAERRKWKKLQAQQKRYEKELLKKNQRVQKRQEKKEIEFIKQYTCKLPPFSSVKDVKSKDCACPPSNTRRGYKERQNNRLDQTGKGEIKIKQSDCACSNVQGGHGLYDNTDTKFKISNGAYPPSKLSREHSNMDTANIKRSDCACSTSQNMQSDCACPSSQLRTYGKNTTDTKQKTKSDCAGPPTNISNRCQNPCCSASLRGNYQFNQYRIDNKIANQPDSAWAFSNSNDFCSVAKLNQFNENGKGDKIASPKAGFDYAAGGSPSNRSDPFSKLRSASKIKLSCSGMSIEDKNFGESDTRSKISRLKIKHMTEYPCRDVGAYCSGPNMCTKQSETCAVSKDSQRNIGVECEPPTTTDQCSATESRSGTGIFAYLWDALRIGGRCSRCSTRSAPPAPPLPCSSPRCSSTSFGNHKPDRDCDIAPCGPKDSPSCDPL